MSETLTYVLLIVIGLGMAVLAFCGWQLFGCEQMQQRKELAQEGKQEAKGTDRWAGQFSAHLRKNTYRAVKQFAAPDARLQRSCADQNRRVQSASQIVPRTPTQD
jgi:hypothetical protein